MPVIVQTYVPSVTGDGDDMFCLRARRLPEPRTRRHRTVPVSRFTAQSSSAFPVATLRNTWESQTIGVDPLSAGNGRDQAMFVVVSHRVGRPVSGLVPFRSGPRHCGQCSALAAFGDIRRSRVAPMRQIPARRLLILERRQQFSCGDGTGGEHSGEQAAREDAGQQHQRVGHRQCVPPLHERGGDGHEGAGGAKQ